MKQNERSIRNLKSVTKRLKQKESYLSKRSLLNGNSKIRGVVNGRHFNNQIIEGDGN